MASVAYGSRGANFVSNSQLRERTSVAIPFSTDCSSGVVLNVNHLGCFMLKAIVPPTSRASGRLSALGISLWILLVGGPLGVILAAGNQVCAEDLDGDREVAANVIRRLAAPVVREQPAVGGVESVTPETWNVHGQFTLVGQYNPDFHARYRGQNSFLTGNQARETIDLTIFAGVHVWQGCDFYANPEMDQGFGLSNTLGLGGYSSGEAYKVGQTYPYARLPRAFFRQVIALSPQQQAVEGGANQLAEMRPVDNVTCITD